MQVVFANGNNSLGQQFLMYNKFPLFTSHIHPPQHTLIVVSHPPCADGVVAPVIGHR